MNDDAKRTEYRAREYARIIYCIRTAQAPKVLDARSVYDFALRAGRGLAECEAEDEAKVRA